MIKLFERIFWHNNTTPAINEDNLNAMSKAIDDIDNRVIDLGADVMEVVPQIQAYLDQAADLVEAMELLTKNPPYIGANGNWYVWDTDTSSFVDSGIDASITVQIADVTMLNYGVAPYITNTGTNTDPIFHLFIPRAAGITSITKTGTSGLVDTYTVTFQDGNTSTFQVTNGKGIVSIAKTSTSGLVDTYTITFNDSTTTTFTVTNGNGDMNKSTYDPQSAVENAGGIPNYVSGAVSSLKSAFTNNVNANGSKNRLQFIVPTGTYYGLSVVNNGKELTVSGTASGNPSNVDIFDITGTWGGTNNGAYLSPEELGIDMSKTYVFSRDAKVNGLRCYIGFWNDTTKLTEIDLNDYAGLSADIDFSQYPTCNRIRCCIIASNNTVIPNGTKFSVMFCLKSDYDLDTTWAVPSKTNHQLTEDSVSWDDFSKVGAVNYAKNNFVVSSTSGITFTLNDDKTVTATGTATANSGFKSSFTLPKGTYRFSGCPSGGSDIKYRMSLTGAFSNAIFDYGDGVIFTITEDKNITIYCDVRSGYAISGSLIFEPMIAPVSYKGPYVPPAKTNKALTDDVSILYNKKQGKETIIRIGYDSGTWQYYGEGKFGSTTTLQDILDYLRNNNVVADKVIIMSNSYSGAYNNSLPVQTGMLVEIIGSPYGVDGFWSRYYVRAVDFRTSKVYIAGVLDSVLQTWKTVSMS